VPAKSQLFSLLVATTFLTGCAGYQGHNGKEPYGYFSNQNEDGSLTVGYETWRPASRNRTCGFAHRRLQELGLDSENVSYEHWEVVHEHTHFREQTAYLPDSGKGMGDSVGVLAVDITPAFVSARVIRRCLLTVKQTEG